MGIQRMNDGKRLKKARETREKKIKSLPSFRIGPYSFRTDGLNTWFEDEEGNMVTGFHAYGLMGGLSRRLILDLEAHHIFRNIRPPRNTDLSNDIDFKAFLFAVRELHQEFLSDIRKALKLLK